ncbi:MAG: glycosyltransferase family 2 protein, partial [Longimicrobiales bacterium]
MRSHGVHRCGRVERRPVSSWPRTSDPPSTYEPGRASASFPNRHRIVEHCVTSTSRVTPVDVSIIVCTRDREQSLAATLRSLRALLVPSDLEAQLVIVDNGAGAARRSAVTDWDHSRLPVQLVTESTRGLSRARNTAVAAAAGRFLLFTDDDVRVPPNWLVRMCEPMVSGRADAVTGTVTLAPHLQRSWMEPFHRATLAATDLVLPEAPGVMMGASMG